jgi:hypothetical protein
LIVVAVASAASCDDPLRVAITRDAAVTQDGRGADLDADADSESPDTSVAADLCGDPDSSQATDAVPPGQCRSQGTMYATLIPVHGTIRGPRVDGVVCDNGVGTMFLGPDGAAGSSYAQGLYSTAGLTESCPDDFLFRVPVFSTSLSGWAGATAPEIGTYASTENCGWLTLEVSFPIPAGVICPPPGEPCEPDCVGVGEMFVCEPAHPKWRYSALPAVQCGASQDPPRGDWQLTLTSISPHVVPDTLISFQTHGRLTATLVNEEDPSDSVVLDLDF